MLTTTCVSPKDIRVKNGILKLLKIWTRPWDFSKFDHIFTILVHLSGYETHKTIISDNDCPVHHCNSFHCLSLHSQGHLGMLNIITSLVKVCYTFPWPHGHILSLLVTLVYWPRWMGSKKWDLFRPKKFIICDDDGPMRKCNSHDLFIHRW